jgi:plasmid maintenance system antidote protein VapI
VKKSPGPPLVEAPAFLRAKLADKEMTQADFALRMGRSRKVVNEVLQGVAGVTWKFAIHCEYVLGIRAADLVKLQMDEELYRARVRVAGQRGQK